VSRSPSPEKTKEIKNSSSTNLTRSNMTFSKVSQEIPSKFQELFVEFKIKQISLPNIELKRV